MEFNLASIIAAIADAVPDRIGIVQGDRSVTYRAFVDRARQVANVFANSGLGAHKERDDLEGHESGQDHVAICLYNGFEYLETMVGAFCARVVPFNVNYRYVEHELVQLLGDQRASAIVFHSEFAPTIESVVGQLPGARLLLQVRDDSGHGLLRGAQWYDEAADLQSIVEPPTPPSPDDLYMLCTGGTTGMPKGVLWRQADIFVAGLSGASTKLGREYGSLDELVEEAVGRGDRFRSMATAPFMHGAGQWSALTALTHGNTCVLPSETTKLDPAAVWFAVEQHGVTMLQMVGEAFARPLLAELGYNSYDVSSLRYIINGGATLGSRSKEDFAAVLPHVQVIDALGTSEAGAVATSAAPIGGQTTSHGEFDAVDRACVLSADRSRRLEPGSTEMGFIATSGRVPLGYHGERELSQQTFPRIGGNRYSISGDRARLDDGGKILLYGRDSSTITSGGEKIFAEEVEQAILHHPEVIDVVVCGRPSERWGSEVVAVVALERGSDATAEELSMAASARIARYKLPKAYVFRDRVERTPAGKPDHRWALEQVR